MLLLISTIIIVMCPDKKLNWLAKCGWVTEWYWRGSGTCYQAVRNPTINSWHKKMSWQHPCNIFSTYEHLCIFAKALWPYRDSYLITFPSFTLITTSASLWIIHRLCALGGVNCVISYPTQDSIIIPSHYMAFTNSKSSWIPIHFK